MDYSVIVPVRNEQETVAQCVLDIRESLSITKATFEIIVVDDGSVDTTPDALQRIAAIVPELRYFRIPPSGQSFAIYSAMLASHGKLLVTLDGDQQIDPRDILSLTNMLNCGYDLVIGNRVGRNDPLARKRIAEIANVFRNWVLSTSIPDSGCSLRVFRRECLSVFFPFSGLHRFIPVLVEIYGGKVISLPVSHRNRQHGVSNYSLVNRFLPFFFDIALLYAIKIRSRRFSSIMQWTDSSFVTQVQAKNGVAITNIQ